MSKYSVFVPETVKVDGIEYINVSPLMTSNNTPPYTASSSSHFNESQGAYTCFDRNAETCFAFYNVPAGWIYYDIAIERNISFIKIAGRSDYPLCNPKDFDIETSEDGSRWEVRKTLSITDWSNLVTIEFDTPIYTRYIRFNIKNNCGFSNTGVGKIGLFEEAPPSEYVTHSKAFHAQTLPMNTTSKILAKTNDSREGLLGMANDADNYGDLYVVGKDGKAHLTKGGAKSEIIFEGNASSVGLYKLTKKITNYSFILIESDSSGGINPRQGSFLIRTDSIKLDTSGLGTFCVSSFANTSWNYSFQCSFYDEETLHICYTSQSGANEWGKAFIKKIIGIY